MLPVIALVGRPNVGKSTLFNRLTRTRDAIVADFSGLTRDRQYGEGRVGPCPYIVIDTGGFEPVKGEGIVREMARQAEAAIAEADIVLFLCDARAGLTPQDERIARRLRTTGREIHLVVNKAEGLDERHTAEFHELGLSDPVRISASHGGGVAALMNAVLTPFVSREPEEEAEEDGRIKVAVAGRPNVGKSTFINQIAGRKGAKAENRPGVTRGKQWVTVDTGLLLLDTPGILWPRFEDPEVGIRLAYTGAVKDDVLDTEALACHLMQMLWQRYPDAIRARYKIDCAPDEEGYALLEAAGRRRGFLISGGEIDTERMARVLLEEYRSCKLGRFTLEEPPVPAADGAPETENEVET